MIVKLLADFSFERKLWRKGFRIIAGADEVGRGCFAGPIVAGCVVFSEGRVTRAGERASSSGNSVATWRKGRGAGERQDPFSMVKIDDSKKLTPRQREKAAVWIKENALTWGIGEISTTLINRIGMAKATKKAFRKAIADANRRSKTPIEFLLMDAFFIPYTKGLRRKNQMAIIHGDEKSKSIGAASIIAKVYRDKLMMRLSKKPKYRRYGWGRNKGYGTREHQEAIKKYGLTRYHRKQFVDTYLNSKH